MAIIRKGDKVAEAELKKAARKQALRRMYASDETKRKAGLEFAGAKTVSKKKDGTTKATKLNLSKSNPRVQSKSPVSGSAITKAKLLENKNKSKKQDAYNKFMGRD